MPNQNKINVAFRNVRFRSEGSGYFRKAIVVGDNTNLTANRVFIDSAEIGIEAGSHCNVNLTDTIVRPSGKITVDLVQAMFADLKYGRSEEELLDRYGKEVEASGIDVDAWLQRGAKFVDLVTAAARLVGLG